MWQPWAQILSKFNTKVNNIVYQGYFVPVRRINLFKLLVIIISLLNLIFKRGRLLLSVKFKILRWRVLFGVMVRQSLLASTLLLLLRRLDYRGLLLFGKSFLLNLCIGKVMDCCSIQPLTISNMLSWMVKQAFSKPLKNHSIFCKKWKEINS